MNKEELLKELENNLKQLSIETKYGKGYFEGGLYRYRENRCIYLNRANSEEYNIELLLSELKKMDWQTIQCNPMIKELLTKSDQNKEEHVMSFQDRKSMRAESDQFISYRVYDKENRICDEGMAKTRDLSRTGVAVENRRPFEVGARVELTIALIKEVIKTESVVRNVKKIDEQTYHIGLEFIKISEEEIEKLRKELPNLIE